MIDPRLQQQFNQQVAQREPVNLLATYILKERHNDPNPPWNWCAACRIEVPARRQHGRPARCEGCDRIFMVSHELEVKNAKLRTSPGFDGMLYGILSACWGEFSLELLTPRQQLEPGSLAFTIEPYELPRKQLKIGERKLSRVERRRRARAASGRGRRFALAFGRGRDRHMSSMEDVYGEPRTYIPKVLRMLVEPGPRERITQDFSKNLVDYCCYQFGYSTNTCDPRCCGAKMVVRAMLYAATDPTKHEGVRRKLDAIMRPMVHQFSMRLHELDMSCWRCSRHDMVRHIDMSKLR